MHVCVACLCVFMRTACVCVDVCVNACVCSVFMRMACVCVDVCVYLCLCADISVCVRHSITLSS